MNTKAIAILGAIFILIVGTLGFLVYTKYSSKSDADTVSQQPASTNTPTPAPAPAPEPAPEPTTTPTGTMAKLTQEQVVSPVLFFEGNGVVYFNKQGLLYRVPFFQSSGKFQLDRAEQIDIVPKSGISKVLWPRNGDDFILEFDTATSTTWSYFNAKTGVYTDYPRQIVAVDWMPSGDKILYIWLENGKATLNISDPDTKNWKQISEMWETDDAISVSPDGNSIAYYRTGSTDMTNKLNLTTPDGKMWNSLVSGGYNYGALWSPDSSKILFTQRDASTQQYQLWYYDLLTGETRGLKVYTALEKVAWSHDSKKVYAAVPMSGTANGSSLTQDKIVEINVATSETKEYNSQAGLVVDGRDLFLAKDDKQLFFRNAQDGALYYLNLVP